MEAVTATDGSVARLDEFHWLALVSIDYVNDVHS